MALINTNADNFAQEVAEGLTLVDFWRTTCNPCKMVAPILEEVSDTLPDIKMIKINISENEAIGDIYEISGAPTLAIFKDGQIVDALYGYQSHDTIVAFITKHT